MINELVEQIKQWHFDRKISINGNSITQLAKLMEEGGELAAGLLRKDRTLVIDSVGDMFVVLVAICEIEDINIEDCILGAYNEIKDRKGYLSEDGVFIKEGC